MDKETEKVIITRTNRENWKVCADLEKQGYIKISDCFWSKHYKKGSEHVFVSFEIEF